VEEVVSSELLEPIEGVDIKTYAQLAATRAGGMSQEDFLKQLAANGMDMEKYNRVEKGWNDRMSSDSTATVATEYGKAFSGAGAGQYGAAGQAAAGFATTGDGTTGVVADGPEPIPFEKYCEIQGAQTAWSNTGQDVNAMLQSTFEMSALDFSNLSAYWMSKYAADPELMTKYDELTNKYQQQYSGGAGGDQDGDIEF
jgi:hypothetical protein